MVRKEASVESYRYEIVVALLKGIAGEGVKVEGLVPFEEWEVTEDEGKERWEIGVGGEGVVLVVENERGEWSLKRVGWEMEKEGESVEVGVVFEEGSEGVLACCLKEGSSLRALVVGEREGRLEAATFDEGEAEVSEEGETMVVGWKGLEVRVGKGDLEMVKVVKRALERPEELRAMVRLAEH